MIDIVRKQDCVGCKACGDACSRQAITYEIDVEGFWYPKINEQACTACGLCDRVCPALQKHGPPVGAREHPPTYKVFHKDSTVRYSSTSGGLYYGIASAFLEHGGYLVGCIYSDGFSGAHHVIADSQRGLEKIMGSKYFQSDTEGIFIQVKALLDKGKKVLFCGAPCQASALYAFVGKDYSGLYTMDFICRGINSPLAFTKYMDELRMKYKSEIAQVHFKNKLHGWTNLGTLVKFANGRTYYRNKYNDPWMNGFVTGNLYMRPCCASCRYKAFPRTGDISMGDFWGLCFSEEEKRLGVSVALSNTEKGDALMAMAADSFVIQKRKLEEAVAGNPALLHPVKSNPLRSEFFQKVQTEPYSKVVWSLLKSNPVKRATAPVRDMAIGWVKKLLKR